MKPTSVAPRLAARSAITPAVSEQTGRTRAWLQPRLNENAMDRGEAPPASRGLRRARAPARPGQNRRESHAIIGGGQAGPAVLRARIPGGADRAASAGVPSSCAGPGHRAGRDPADVGCGIAPRCGGPASPLGQCAATSFGGRAGDDRGGLRGPRAPRAAHAVRAAAIAIVTARSARTPGNRPARCAHRSPR